LFNIFTKSQEETYELGIKIGKLLEPGMIICLSGDLGTGKTHLTKGIAVGIGINEYVTSPTYTLINEYYGEMSLYHFDVYRLENSDELNELGYTEYFYGKGVCVIEWADIISEAIPVERLWIVLHIEKNGNRRFVLDASGIRHKELLDKLEGALL